MNRVIIMKDRRLIEALDYIDDEYIASAALYKMRSYAESTRPLAQTAGQSVKKHWKHYLGFVACLLVLALATPLFTHLPEIINSFAAGWAQESETLKGDETTNEIFDESILNDEVDIRDMDITTENIATEEVADTVEPIPEMWMSSMVFSFPAEMTPEQIYDEVGKGGWVVENEDYFNDFVAGANLWYYFCDKANQGEPASVLVAEYNDCIYNFEVDVDLESYIYLTEIIYDGNVFKFIKYDYRNHAVLDSGEYKYLIADIFEYDYRIASRGRQEAYFLTNDNTWTYREYLHGQLCNLPIHRNERNFNRDCELIIHHTIHYDDTVTLPSGDYPFYDQSYMYWH